MVKSVTLAEACVIRFNLGVTSSIKDVGHNTSDTKHIFSASLAVKRRPDKSTSFA